MKKIIRESNTRFYPNRFQIKQFEKNNSGIIGVINSFLEIQGNNYLGFGGLGDLILLLANCYNDNLAKVIFFSNNQEISNLFLNTFSINKFLVFQNIMGQPLASFIYKYFKKSNHKPSAHLADNLDYKDWKNEDKYISRINLSPDWKNKFGYFNNRKILTIAPHGSNRDDSRKRYLNNLEYSLLIDKYKKEFDEIYIVGSTSDLSYYGNPVDENVYFSTFDNIIDFKGNYKKIKLNDILKIINTSELVISVDTWLKTYSCLNNIQTKVIKTKWNGSYKSYGQDVSDYIFINKNIWKTLELVKFEDLI